jgi:hypothetical protein
LGVTTQRVLDLEDVGAPVGEDCSRCRDERELRKLQDPKALHHVDQFSLPLTFENLSNRERYVGSNVTGSAFGERKGWP